MTATNGELWGLVNEVERKTCKVVVSAEQYQANLNFVVAGRDTLTAKCKERDLGMKFIPGLTENARRLRNCVTELEEACSTKALMCELSVELRTRKWLLNKLILSVLNM